MSYGMAVFTILAKITLATFDDAIFDTTAIATFRVLNY